VHLFNSFFHSRGGKFECAVFPNFPSPSLSPWLRSRRGRKFRWVLWSSTSPWP
jgi:hypothetical protein